VAFNKAEVNEDVAIAAKPGSRAMPVSPASKPALCEVMFSTGCATRPVLVKARTDGHNP